MRGSHSPNSDYSCLAEEGIVCVRNRESWMQQVIDWTRNFLRLPQKQAHRKDGSLILHNMQLFLYLGPKPTALRAQFGIVHIFGQCVS